MNNFNTIQDYEQYGIKCNTRSESNGLPTRCIDRRNNKNQTKWQEFLDFYDKIKDKNDALFYIDTLLNAYMYKCKINYSFDSLELAIYTLFAKDTKGMTQVLHLDSFTGSMYQIAQENEDRGDILKIAYLYALKAFVTIQK